MSRLHRAETHSRFFFLTTNLLRDRRPFNEREFTAPATILDRTRKRLPFALCGYCFMPDHVHALIFPEETTTISNVMKSFKLGTFQESRGSQNRDPRHGLLQDRAHPVPCDKLPCDNLATEA